MRGLVVVAAALLVSACLSDPVGPQGLRLVVLDGSDSVWVGRPGDDTIVRVRVVTELGEPAPGVRLQWVPTGTGGTVTAAAVVSGRDGYATAEWRIGTDATDRQELRVTARGSRAMDEVVIRGRVVPSVVAALRAVADTPFVVRLSDSLTPRFVAVDSFNNTFAPPTLTVTSADSAVVRVVSGTLVSGSRRGSTMITASGGGHELRVPVRVVQVAAAIELTADTLRFTSLGAELPVPYVVRDDRGLIIADTAIAVSVADTAIVQVVNQTVRASRPGVTGLRLDLGLASATMAVAVRQRVASLRLERDTIRLYALADTITVRAIARDSLGAVIQFPRLVYQVSNDSVARLAARRTLEAVRPGVAVLTAVDTITGISASADVVVRQLVATIDVALAATRFDAIGDSVAVTVAARDPLGNVVEGPALDYGVSDSTVLAITANGFVRAIRAGQAEVVARDLETGVVGTAQLLVDPVAMSLNVSVDFGSPVVTLPVGATLPLVCEGRDRNGVTVEQPASLVGSVRGTVVGSACGALRVERSGYDTLHFALGQASASVPVIIATRPDSVGILAAAQPLTLDERIRFVGEDLSHPLILALRPLVAEIMRSYGNPTSDLDRARAIRDWVARTAILPDPAVHPDGSVSNLSVLPVGTTWSDLNAVVRSPSKWTDDHAYWDAQRYDGYAMLDRLLGTLDPLTGIRADDGLMEHVSGARYRIRDIGTYRYTLCTFQSIITHALWGAAGLQGLRAATLDHDAAAVFIPDLGRWVYQDPTFNEEYVLDGVGDPLSPVDLLALSAAGQAGRLQARKMAGPSFDPAVYGGATTYVMAGHQAGMVVMGSQLNARVVGTGGAPTRYVQIETPGLDGRPFFGDSLLYARVSAIEAFPTLGVVIERVDAQDSVFVVRLASTFPNHQGFERRVQGGAWESAAAIDVLPVGACRVEYRSIDAIGNVSAYAVLGVWAPRADGFVEDSDGASIRRQSSFCV